VLGVVLDFKHVFGGPLPYPVVEQIFDGDRRRALLCLKRASD
jgi:hypothetical protein